MALPTRSDVLTLDYSGAGQPAAYVEAKTLTPSSATLDYTLAAQPVYGLANLIPPVTVDVTGVEAVSGTGVVDVAAAISALVSVTAVEGSAAVGQAIASIAISAFALGVAADVGVGTVTVTGGSNVFPLGVQAVGKVSSPLFWQTINDSQIANWQPVSDAQFGAWTPVDDGNIVVWTEIPT